MKFLLKFFGYLFGIGAVCFLVLAAGGAWYLSKIPEDLPDYTALKNYAPPVMTRVHAADGSLVAEYAEQRRMFLPIQGIPDLVKDAFISAEDKNFYHHPGIDITGVGRAVLVNLRNRLTGSNRRLVGASTITQQVAKNFLLTNEVSYERKIKETILALRIEDTYTKYKILELYLNEIYLGMGAYGVAGASLLYFDKSVHELDVAEAAYLAALPKAPNNYNPFRHPKAAIARRNWVIDRMVENGYVKPEDGEKAKAEPLKITPRETGPQLFASEYFSEEVRREVKDMYGKDRLYTGGLSVRSTLDPKMQAEARKSLMDGLIHFDRKQGTWRDPVDHVDLNAGEWGGLIGDIDHLTDVPEWKLAVVLDVNADRATIGVQPEKLANGHLSTDRERGHIDFSEIKWVRRVKDGTHSVKSSDDVLKVGDVVYVEKIPDPAGGKSTAWKLRQIPEVSGAIVAMDPFTGRVLAMVGGFSYNQSEFNRATQAYRQPGSSFKPFVYSAALDNGYTPSSVIMDAPISVEQAGGEVWQPQNYGGKFYGPSTLRTGIEKSRNIMTVRLAQDMGMPLVAEYARRFGIYDKMLPVLSMALGAGETTVMRMTVAYSMIANGGRKVTSTLIDRIQDRYGRTIFKHDSRECVGCNATDWHGQDEPKLIDNREQVLDPMTAYQITSMMEGVVQRGTATSVHAVGRPIAGKTGTTNDERDAWFMGFSPNLTVGVFVGYDTPRPMGRGQTGGHIAAPIFTEFMKQALADKPAMEFRVPPGIKLIPIDSHTGLRATATADSPDTILEAFKPGTAPPDNYSIIGYQDEMGQPGAVTPEADRAIMTGTGGLY
ncbi:penicillin-binding protein 1A [Breoghania sp.]|uniref:penicillin-binding protein 1A n=1 Tax=Breoghania sp. TaxID=2065378 RepID=UPI00261E9022|nr:penicillin-binding protein 1A [Breoghania sp.]MDJ0930765.1 penicillin-binding protein 1A [Breoghania sp.]